MNVPFHDAALFFAGLFNFALGMTWGWIVRGRSEAALGAAAKEAGDAPDPPTNKERA